MSGGDLGARHQARMDKWGTLGCIVPGCERAYHSRGYCLPHYSRWRRNGVVYPDQPIRQRVERSYWCAVPGCMRRRQTLEWCKAHYSRLWRHGDVQAEKPVAFTRVCQEPGCRKNHKARGMCHMHYMRWWKARKETAASHPPGG